MNFLKFNFKISDQINKRGTTLSNQILISFKTKSHLANYNLIQFYYPTLVPYFSSVNCIDNFDFSSIPINPDKYVKIRNRGWYIASLALRYEYNNQIVTQTGLVTSGLEYGFLIPFSVNYESEFGCILEASAVAGINIINNIRVDSNPLCIDIWGTTLAPLWSKIDC